MINQNNILHENNQKPIHIIRPAGRHVLTIGRELIQDLHAAIIELVKNAYDADASKVILTFEKNIEKDIQTITVSDDGHGMAQDTVINKWLVPSTDDKLKRKESPIKKRKMQGQKGIGRYAASILGDDLLLETTDIEGNTTTIYLDWTNFLKVEFLDQVEILVETAKTNNPSGTALTINCKASESEWSIQKFYDLKFQLKKLISPKELAQENLVNIKNADSFEIELITKNFLNQNSIETIEPFPLLELSDYRIFGKINEDGKGELTYIFQKYKNTKDSTTIHFDYNKPTNCGGLFFDIRVYDRGPEDISNLIQKGLKDEDGNYVAKTQAKALLNANNGIGVYRNGFRIRPLGDPDFDWLELNKRRVQNPSIRIGSDQVIGFVLIESEDISNLIEKTARDGLRDNLSYDNLIDITQSVISELEIKRRTFRSKLKKTDNKKLNDLIQDIFSYDNLRNEIHQQLSLEHIKPEVTKKIIESLERDAGKRQEKIEYIQQQVAIFQAQATLGKLVQYVIHEGRQPLAHLKDTIYLLNSYIQNFLKDPSEDLSNSIELSATRLDQGVVTLSQLFKRIDPLATGRRGKAMEFLLGEQIQNSYEVAGSELSLDKRAVTLTLNGFEGIIIKGHKQDLMSLFINLFTNSLYWLWKTDSYPKNISIECVTNKENVIDYIDYRDTGPGINNELIKSEVIFEPGFTTKPDGMGIGLTISGETANRLGFNLLALEAEGAYFRLINKEIEETNE